MRPRHDILHLMVRLILLAAALFAITFAPPEASAPAVIFTSDPGLQLLRLYTRTNGVWAQDDLREFNQLIGGEFFGASPLEALELQMKAGEWETVKDYLRSTLVSNPDDQQANFWLGLLLIPEPEALLFIEKVASLPGTYQAEAAVVLGVVKNVGYQPRDVAIRLVEMGEWVFAERLFTLQIEQDNLDAFSYAYRGFVRDQMGGDGRYDIEMALTLEPTSALTFYMLGLHERRVGNFDASLDAFINAYLLAPENPAYAAEIATAYQVSGDLPLAEDWFSAAVEFAPNDSRFIALKAAFYADNNYKLDSTGMQFVQGAAATYPQNADIQASWGWALFLREDFTSAGGILTRAFELDPMSPRIRFFMGNWMEHQGDRVEAVSHYFFVAQTENPYKEAAQRALEYLMG